MSGSVQLDWIWLSCQQPYGFADHCTTPFWLPVTSTSLTLIKNLEKKELFCGVPLTDIFTATAKIDSAKIKEMAVMKDVIIGFAVGGTTVTLSPEAIQSSFQFTHVSFQYIGFDMGSPGTFRGFTIVFLYLSRDSSRLRKTSGRACARFMVSQGSSCILKRHGASRGRQAVSELVLLKEMPFFWLQCTSAWCRNEVTAISDSSFNCLKLLSPVNSSKYFCHPFSLNQLT